MEHLSLIILVSNLMAINGDLESHKAAAAASTAAYKQSGMERQMTALVNAHISKEYRNVASNFYYAHQFLIDRKVVIGWTF